MQEHVRVAQSRKTKVSKHPSTVMLGAIYERSKKITETDKNPVSFDKRLRANMNNISVLRETHFHRDLSKQPAPPAIAAKDFAVPQGFVRN